MKKNKHLPSLGLALILAAAWSPAALAQQHSAAAATAVGAPGTPGARATPTRQPSSAYRTGGTSEPDVLLDVPHLSVDELHLEVDNLEVHLALDARLANLLKLTAGADVKIDKVKLDIKGVQAEALLKVRLDNVRGIIDRTLTTLDKNPQILTRLLQSVDTTVGTVGGVANTALQPGGVVSQTVNSLGQTVQQVVDQTGNIVEQTLDASGKVLSSRVVGRAGAR